MSEEVDMEAIGKVVTTIVDKVVEKVIMPWDLDTIKYLVQKDVTLGDIYRTLMEEIESGEAVNWRKESKEMWAIIYNALKFGRSIVRKLPIQQTVTFLKFDKVLEYLKEKKPEYYEYFTKYASAQVWLKRNIKELRILLYGYDPLVA